MKPKNRRATLGVHTTLIVLGLVFVSPLLWMILTAIKPIQETMTSPPTLLPSKALWGNFPAAITYRSEELGYVPFLVYGRNTLLITLLSVTGAVCSNALVAYAFARLKWPGRDFLFGVTLATMMIPFPVLMVPTFALFKWLGWVGTF